MVVNWEIEKKINVIQRIAWLESFLRLGVMTDKKAEECIRTILVAKKTDHIHCLPGHRKDIFFQE